MSINSVFSNGKVPVTVGYINGSSNLLFSGTIGLNESVSFPDIDADYTCSLSVDSNGVVTLATTKGAQSWSVGGYAVEILINASGSSMAQIIDCQNPQWPGANQAAVLDGNSNFFTGDSYVYPSLPISAMGFEVYARPVS